MVPHCPSRCPTLLQRRRRDEVDSADEVAAERRVDEVRVVGSPAEVVIGVARRGLAGPRLLRKGMAGPSPVWRAVVDLAWQERTRV